MKFFDRKTETLFITEGKTSVAHLSDNPLIQIPEPNGPSFYKLRRRNAGIGNFFEKDYISRETGQELHGNYDLNHSSNADLIHIKNTIYCP